MDGDETKVRCFTTGGQDIPLPLNLIVIQVGERKENIMVIRPDETQVY